MSELPDSATEWSRWAPHGSSDQDTPHGAGSADIDSIAPAHEAGSTDIERKDTAEAQQQPAAEASKDNGDMSSNEASTSDEPRQDDTTEVSNGSADGEAASASPSTSVSSADDGAPSGGPAASEAEPTNVEPTHDRLTEDELAADRPAVTEPIDAEPAEAEAAKATPTETAPQISPSVPIEPQVIVPADPIPPAPATSTPPPPTETLEPARGGAYRFGEERPIRRVPATVETAEGQELVGPRHLRKSTDEKAVDESAAEERRRRRNLLLLVSPAFFLVLLVVVWAVDTAALSGQVVRNVELAGQGIGGRSEDHLSDLVASMAEDIANREVTINVTEATSSPPGDAREVVATTYTTTAGSLGLTLDQEATVEAALDVGRGDSLFVRPFKWAASFMSSREAPLRFDQSESQAATTLQLLQGADQTAALEPTIRLGESGFVAVDGQPGTGLHAGEVGDSLLAAVEESDSTDSPIEISARATQIAPRFTLADAEALAQRANELTANGLTLKAADVSGTVDPQQLRQWVRPVQAGDGDDPRLELTFDTAAATAAAPQVLAELSAEPQNATVVIEGGQPVVRPGRPGATCCGEDAGQKMWDALKAGETEVTYDVQVTEPEHTTEEVEQWGIREPIGGARAHRNGADIAGPQPGYTTYHDCCAARVTNIQRIAQLVDGVVVPPGGSFSINDHVGRRTREKGFVPAGAILNGRHVDDVGGGVSQFFTTLFNAAFFAGLDIDEYQAHSENFARYPDGREATGGFPNPDLVITNNTPHGVLIDTSYTGTSVTVTLWSTPYYTSSEQTGISRSPSGDCQVVTVSRTRTSPAGTQQDSFRATYRPGEGLGCNGPLPPPPG